MKRMTQVATFVCMILFLASCSQEDHLSSVDLQVEGNDFTSQKLGSGLDDPIITTAPSDFPMELGNQWEYLERTYNRVTGTYNLESTITETIIGTEVINGDTYYKFEKDKGGNTTYFYRRFADNGDLVDETGALFYSGNFTDVVYIEAIDPAIAQYLGDIEYRMVGSTTPLTVPAGTFSVTRGYQGVSLYVQPNQLGETQLVTQADYAMGVGLVKTTCPSLSGRFIVYKELVSYSLN